MGWDVAQVTQLPQATVSPPENGRHTYLRRRGFSNRNLGATPTGSDSAGLCWGPVIFISNQFPDNNEAAGWGHFENHCSRRFQVVPSLM